MMEHSHWTKESMDSNPSTKTATNSFTLDLNTTASSGQEHGSRPSKKDGQSTNAESSIPVLSEENSKLLAILVGTLIGWPLRTTVIWLILGLIGGPFALTWLQVFGLVAIIDFIRA